MRLASPELVEDLLDQLRTCSDGRRECVCYLLADQREPEVVVAVEHPLHRSAADHYVIDDAWLTGFFLALADTGRTVVAQVHTHPTAWVGHSWVDDDHPIVPMPGLVSVVVPWFGHEPDPGAFGIHRLRPDGTWVGDPGAIAW